MTAPTTKPDPEPPAKATKRPDRPDDLADNSVCTSNDLVRASYSLSLNEQRLLLAAISKVNPRATGHQSLKIRITAHEFAKTFNIDMKRAYSDLKEASNSLFERELRPVGWRGKPRMRWISTYVDYEEGQGYADLTLNEDLRPYLTVIGRMFTSYNLGRAVSLRRPTTIRLFQLLMQFEKTGLCVIKLKDFIDMMELPYTRFADVRRWVIEPALAELKKKSNLTIVWKPESEKGGRAVDTLKFSFRETPQKELDLSVATAEESQ